MSVRGILDLFKMFLKIISGRESKRLRDPIISSVIQRSQFAAIFRIHSTLPDPFSFPWRLINLQVWRWQLFHMHIFIWTKRPQRKKKFTTNKSIKVLEPQKSILKRRSLPTFNKNEIEYFYEGKVGFHFNKAYYTHLATDSRRKTLPLRSVRVMQLVFVGDVSSLKKL